MTKLTANLTERKLYDDNGQEIVLCDADAHNRFVARYVEEALDRNAADLARRIREHRAAKRELRAFRKQIQSSNEGQ